MTVLGNTWVPPSIGGRFVAVCAVLRQLHLVFALLWSYRSGRRQPYDVYFVDQLSTAVPILRWLTYTRVLFYCHFPDLLLSPNRDPSGPADLLRQLYRGPIDFLEEQTTSTPAIKSPDYY